jgi:dolichyl-phosphate-mannose--protein O-mannosyl transferase
MTAADGSQVVEGMISIGNPVFFAAIPIAVVWGAYRALWCRSVYHTIVLIAVFTQWLQWSWVPQNTFLHYFYTVLPFAALLIGDVLVAVWRSSVVGKVLCATYITAAVGMFAYWYPLLTAMQVSRAFVDQHMWIESWW